MAHSLEVDEGGGTENRPAGGWTVGGLFAGGFPAVSEQTLDPAMQSFPNSLPERRYVLLISRDGCLLGGLSLLTAS